MRPRTFTGLTTLIVLALLGLPGLARERVPTMEASRRLLERGKHAQAEEAFAAIVAAEPGNGEAWLLLAAARHAAGDYAGAIEANDRAADFAVSRPTALYNRACAQALAGHATEAGTSLDEAIAAGFLDFDLMASDTDLDSIRAGLDLPPVREFQELEGRNGVVVPYLVQLPRDHDPLRPTPALVSFAPGGHGPRATSWAIEHFWGGAAQDNGWILVHVVAPERGWFTHPSHHALEDLLKKLAGEHEIAGGQFHAFGFAEGARPATTYSRMSARYFETLNVASGSAWDRWDESDLDDFRRTPVNQFVGADDGGARPSAERVAKLLGELGCENTLTLVPDAGRMLEGTSGSALLGQIAQQVIR